MSDFLFDLARLLKEFEQRFSEKSERGVQGSSLRSSAGRYIDSVRGPIMFEDQRTITSKRSEAAPRLTINN